MVCASIKSTASHAVVKRLVVIRDMFRAVQQLLSIITAITALVIAVREFKKAVKDFRNDSEAAGNKHAKLSEAH